MVGRDQDEAAGLQPAISILFAVQRTQVLSNRLVSWRDSWQAGMFSHSETFLKSIIQAGAQDLDLYSSPLHFPRASTNQNFGWVNKSLRFSLVQKDRDLVPFRVGHWERENPKSVPQ